MSYLAGGAADKFSRAFGVAGEITGEPCDRKICSFQCVAGVIFRPCLVLKPGPDVSYRQMVCERWRIIDCSAGTKKFLMHYYYELFSVGAGMMIFLVSLGMFYRVYLLSSVRTGRLRWIVLGVFVTCFLAGYGTFFVVILNSLQPAFDVNLLVSQIFLGGSIFVFTCAWIFFSVLRENKEIDEQLREALVRLQHAQKLEAVGRLAGNVAHDFNNLLTSIMGHADLGLHGTDPQTPQGNNFKQIGEAAQRAEKLTSQLLAFSRKDPPRVEPLSIQRLIIDSKSLLEQAVDSSAELTIRIEDPGWVKGDADQIKMIMLNLLNNASDAVSLHASGKIELALQKAERDVVVDRLLGNAEAKSLGDYVEVSVTDNGQGMEEGVRDQIFEPYFTTKDSGKGTGLGLSIAYGVARQHNGYLDVESQPGNGACFKLYLPEVTDVEMVSAPDPQPTVADQAPRKNLSVLVIDDDHQVLAVAELILKQAGYAVTVASDATQVTALMEAQANQYDLVLSDVLLPHHSGPEIVALIKAHNPDQRVVYMSGFPGETTELVAGAFEEHRLIMKPFSAKDLISAINEAV